jgi:signal transduction histidine kinase
VGLIRLADSVRLGELAGQTKGNNSEGPQFYVAILLSHVATGGAPDHDVLVVTFPVQVNNQQIHRDWTELVIYGLVMLALACLFGLFVSGSLVKPLRRIGSAVEAIGGGSLEVRAPVTGGPPELRRLAESINSTAVRLINLLQAQRVFVQDASHQLRTPLTALQLRLENLQHGEGPPDAELGAAIAEVSRLSRLVDSLLVLARAESTSPDLVVVDLHQAALERVEVWRPLADEMQIGLASSVPEGVVALATPGAIEQVLDNLLSNAFDATPPGGLVRVESSVTDDGVELHVLDTGTGLSPAERSLALQRFWRGRGNPNEGTGLGLAIVDQLTRLCGGSVELREAASGGLDATVSLRRG